MKIEQLLITRQRWINFLVLILCASCVLFSTGPTLRLVRQYWDLERRAATVTHQPKAKNVGHRKFNLIDIQSVDINKQTFDALAKIAPKYEILIEKTDTPTSHDEPNGTVTTQRVTLLGRYSAILKCLNEVGAQLPLIKIAAVQFNREQRDKISVLVATVYFQSVKPQKS